MKAPKSNQPRILPPKGTNIGRVIEIIYLGTQAGEWSGQPKNLYKVRIKWELPMKKRVFKEGEEEKPFVVGAKFTLSMGSKANLRPIVQGILGVDLTDDEANSFDLDDILDRACLVKVDHKDSKNGQFATVTATTPLMDGQICPPAYNKLKILSFPNWDESLFQSLPDFIRKEIESSPEYQRMKGITTEAGDSVIPMVPPKQGVEYPVEDINPDDIPF